MAMIHIQKIAPGPPLTIAIAMPAILPTPTREAVLTQNAWKEEIWLCSVFCPTPSFKRRTISFRQRTCTNRVRNENQIPRPTSITIRTYDHKISLVKATKLSKNSIFSLLHNQNCYYFSLSAGTSTYSLPTCSSCVAVLSASVSHRSASSCCSCFIYSKILAC